MIDLHVHFLVNLCFERLIWKHIDKVLKHKDLEVQLANAKLQQSELKLTESTERNKKEKALVT